MTKPKTIYFQVIWTMNRMETYNHQWGRGKSYTFGHIEGLRQGTIDKLNLDTPNKILDYLFYRSPEMLSFRIMNGSMKGLNALRGI